jgi:hypothetical protein
MRLFSLKILNFSMKSFPFSSLKKSQVFHAITVSVSPHFQNANTGFQAAIISIGTIQKSSSPGKINHWQF